MNLEFSKLINFIEAEIAADYLPGAIAWADRKFDFAWSKALDRFDAALSLAVHRKDYMTAKIEGEFYKATILDLIRKFKTEKNMDDTQSLLLSLRSSQRS